MNNWNNLEVGDILIPKASFPSWKKVIITEILTDGYYKIKIITETDNAQWPMELTGLQELYDICPEHQLNKQFNSDLKELINEK